MFREVHFSDYKYDKGISHKGYSRDIMLQPTFALVHCCRDGFPVSDLQSNPDEAVQHVIMLIRGGVLTSMSSNPGCFFGWCLEGSELSSIIATFFSLTPHSEPLFYHT